MAASKQLVFLPMVNAKTWLLMTKRKQGTCLRDYSTTPHTSIRSYSLDELDAMLAQDGSYSEKPPAFSRIPFSDEVFWREQIAFRNAESGRHGGVEERRLQERFKEQCMRALDQPGHAKLRAVFEHWTERFRCIKQKEQFNHWDNDPAASKYSAETGIGWTSQLLEQSRKNGKIHFIPTGCDITEFSLVAMELGFGISSKNNEFRKGQTDFIKPDGLALRRNGYFTVIEVKGPQDEADLIGPLLQTTCAALALVAKKEMIQRIAVKEGERRPAFPRAEIPEARRSIGIHILSQAGPDGGPRVPWTPKVESTCLTVINAFTRLEYVAYSFVSTDEARNLKRLNTDVLVTREGVARGLKRPQA